MEYTDSLLDELQKIARAAGERILEIYANEADFEIESKSDDSPLTKADKAANDIICAGLEALENPIPIISEENKAIPFEERKNYAYCWLVDPLDGTKEFIKRNGEFTVNIALLHENRPVIGIVYAPVLDEMYAAAEGKGAFLTQNGETRRLFANKYSMDDAGLRVVCSRSHLNDETQAFINDLIEPEKVSKGSSLKFLMIAKGEAEVYPRIAPTMEWDTGAAHCVLTEARGAVLQYGTDKSLTYNKENLLNPFFIARGQLMD